MASEKNNASGNGRTRVRKDGLPRRARWRPRAVDAVTAHGRRGRGDLIDRPGVFGSVNRDSFGGGTVDISESFEHTCWSYTT
jgi:hypothetical protein